jgi:hypothetical protein
MADVENRPRERQQTQIGRGGTYRTLDEQKGRVSPAEERFERTRRTVGLFLAPVVAAGPGAPAGPEPHPAEPGGGAGPGHRAVDHRGDLHPRGRDPGLSLCVLLGVASADGVFAALSDSTIFLFIGSFIVAEVMLKHGVDRRFAYGICPAAWVGSCTTRIILAFGMIGAVPRRSCRTPGGGDDAAGRAGGDGRRRRHDRRPGQGRPRPRAAALPRGAAGLVFLLPVDWAERRFTLTWNDAARIGWGHDPAVRLRDRAGLADARDQAGQVGRRGPGRRAERVQPDLDHHHLGADRRRRATPPAPRSWCRSAILLAGAVGISPSDPRAGGDLRANHGFMLPVSTPPNAIVYSSGLLPITRMVKAGAVFDVIGAVLCVVGVAVAARVVGLA